MRRRVGASYVFSKQQQAARFDALGERMFSAKAEQARRHYSEFKERLSNFAQKHKSRINKDPEFRQRFHEMCTTLGVDPLACNAGMWTTFLGIGSFYSRLGVQVLTICLTTREENGGLLDMQDLLKRLLKHNQSTAHISCDDIERAIEKLSILGIGGISIVKSKENTLIISIPEELSADQLNSLKMAQTNGYIHQRMLTDEFGWTSTRCEKCFDLFLRDGTVWIDTQTSDDQSWFWFPSIYFRLTAI